MVKTVAVIGAGSSGLAAIKCCLDEGLNPVAFERSDGVGGLWRFRKRVEEGNGCVMSYTVSNSSKELMGYTDFPPPETMAMMPHHSEVQKYFQLYAEHFDLNPRIRFNVEVTLVRRADDYVHTGRWTVHSTDHKSGESKTELFDAVLVCTGHHGKELIPDFPGLDEFEGTKVHSRGFSPSPDLRGKTMLVVGMSNSAGDMAVEMSRHGQVFMSTRRGAWVYPIVCSRGIAVDMVFNCRHQVFKDRLSPSWWLQATAAAFLNQGCDHDFFGLTPQHLPLSQFAFANDELFVRLANGSVKLTEDIKRFTRNGVEFLDGTCENIDMVAFATGYTMDYAFIEKEVLDIKNNEVPLHLYMFPTHLPHNTLAVIGCILPVGTLWTASEMQCRLATRVFKGTHKLPTGKEMCEEVMKREEIHKKMFLNTPRNTVNLHWLVYMEQLAGIIGCKPDIGKLLLTDPVLAYKLWFEPAWPYSYRLQGPGKWSGACQAILTAMDRVRFPFHQRRKLPVARMPVLFRVAQWFCFPPPLFVFFLVLMNLLLVFYVVVY